MIDKVTTLQVATTNAQSSGDHQIVPASGMLLNSTQTEAASVSIKLEVDDELNGNGSIGANRSNTAFENISSSSVELNHVTIYL